MGQKQLSNLTIEFLEDAANGLRLITQSNWAVECLLSSRLQLESTLENNLGRKWFDVPGVYLLAGPVAKEAEVDRLRDDKLYVGQADSVADRLDSHLRNENKKWWRTVLVLRRTDTRPLNISQCRFMESRLYSLALSAGNCELDNRVAPQPAFLSPTEQSSTEVFLDQALVIVSALGFDYFRAASRAPETSQPAIESREPPSPPASLLPLLEEICKAVTGPSFPKAKWYSTHVPDFRSKVALSEDVFRVFVRITWAKNWFWVSLKDVGKYKVSKTEQIDKLREAIQTAYQKAEQHLQRVK
jgi:hypothetical protein